MYSASLPALLRTLLIIGVVFLVVRLFSKMMQAQRDQKDMRNRMEKEIDEQRLERERARRTIRDDGKTRVEYTRKPGMTHDEGEFVDYEELDD